MNKLIKSLMIGALVTIGSSVFAEGKVAVFNLQGAILNTTAAQEKIKEFEAKASIAELKAQGESILADMQKLDKDAQTNGVTWSDEQKAEARKNLEYKRVDLEVVNKKLQQEQQLIVNQILQSQAQAANAIIQELVKSEGIGLILDAKSVMYADSSYDITAKITDRLNSAGKK